MAGRRPECRRAREDLNEDMNLLAQFAVIEFSPALRAAALVLGGVIALVVAIKVGQVIVRLLFGLIGLALLGGAVWWFLSKH